MNIFGRYVSIQVLWLSFVSLAGLVGGLVTSIINGWSTKNVEGDILLIAGAVMSVITGGLHIWDTMPTNVTNADAAKVPAAPPAAPPAVVH